MAGQVNAHVVATISGESDVLGMAPQAAFLAPGSLPTETLEPTAFIISGNADHVTTELTISPESW